MSTISDAELERLRTAHKRLQQHLRDAHGIAMGGSANELERRHMAAHRAEGTPWHADAYQLDPPEEPVDADAEEGRQ